MQRDCNGYKSKLVSRAGLDYTLVCPSNQLTTLTFIHPFIYLFVCWSVCLFVYDPVSITFFVVFLCVCPAVPPSVHPYVRTNIHPPFRPSKNNEKRLSSFGERWLSIRLFFPMSLLSLLSIHLPIYVWPSVHPPSCLYVQGAVTEVRSPLSKKKVNWDKPTDRPADGPTNSDF